MKYISLFPLFVSKRRLPDNFVFYLHYRWTVLLLLTIFFIVTCKLFVGYSFKCGQRQPMSIDFQRYVDSKCYDESVYILTSETIDSNKEDSKRYQYYYSWVNLFLLSHAFMFYLPHLLWKSYESEHMKRLTTGLFLMGAKEEKRGKELSYLAKYLHVTQGKHQLYTLIYIFCEILNFVVAISLTLWLEKFFNVTSKPDTIEVATWDDFQRFYFPSEGKCVIKVEGASGDLQKHTFFCALSMNKLYMLLYLCLRGWYILLAILSGIVLIYRTALLLSSVRVNVTRFHAPLSKCLTLKALCLNLSYADWFFLSRFQMIMNDVDFAQMLQKIAIISESKTCENLKEIENPLTACDENEKEHNNSSATSPV